MKAANGTGIVSTVTLESDDLDEIDWEWLGGDNTQVQTDYFGKGNTTSYDRGGYSSVTDAQGTTHNYTIDWTSEQIVWYIDGTATRTLACADAVSGTNFPQTPMRVKLGIWAGGDPDNAEGTIEWAGGETDYTAGPYTMTVSKVTVWNANPGATYTYGDMTGDYSSIVVGDASANATENTGSSDSSSSSSSSSSTSSSSSSNKTSSNSTTTASTATATSSSTKTSSTSSSTATTDVTSAGVAVQASVSVAMLLAAVAVLLN
jgi:beta-glucanase (GH16 family)